MGIERARNTTINLGATTIEVLLLPDGKTIRVRLKELERLSLAPTKQGLRSLKRALGEGLNYDRVASENSNNPESAISVETFIEFIKVMRKRGNQLAEQITDDLVGLSITQLAYDAFGIKFEKEQRVAWLEARQESKREFRTLTDAFQRVLGFTRSEEYQAGVAQFQAALDICNGCRDILDGDKLKKLSRAEVTASALLDAGMPWGEVLGLLTKMR